MAIFALCSLIHRQVTCVMASRAKKIDNEVQKGILKVIDDYPMILRSIKGDQNVRNGNVPYTHALGKYDAGDILLTIPIEELLYASLISTPTTIHSESILKKKIREVESGSIEALDADSRRMLAMCRMVSMMVFCSSLYVDNRRADGYHISTSHIGFYNGNYLQEYVIVKDETHTSKDLVFTVTNWKMASDNTENINNKDYVKDFFSLFAPVMDQLEKDTYRRVVINVDNAVAIITKNVEYTKIVESLGHFVCMALAHPICPVEAFAIAFVRAIGRFLMEFADAIKKKRGHMPYHYSWLLRYLSIKLQFIDKSFADECSLMHRMYCCYINSPPGIVKDIEYVDVNCCDEKLNSILPLPTPPVFYKAVYVEQLKLLKQDRHREPLEKDQHREPLEKDKKGISKQIVTKLEPPSPIFSPKLPPRPILVPRSRPVLTTHQRPVLTTHQRRPRSITPLPLPPPPPPKPVAATGTGGLDIYLQMHNIQIPR